MVFTKEDIQNGQSLISYIVWKVIIQKENIIIFIVGPTGRGKSYAALRLMELIQKEVAAFLERGKIVYTAPDGKPYEHKYKKRVDISQATVSGNEFLAAVNKPAPAYSCVMFDEVGVAAGGAAARKWASDINQSIVDVTQTFRNMQLFTLFTAPATSYLDSKVRDLVHVQVTMKKKHVEKGFVEAKIYFCEITNNPYQSSTVSKWRPRLKGPTGKIIIDKVMIRKPNKRLCELYENKIFHRKKEIRLISEKALLESKEKMSKAEMREEQHKQIAKDISNLKEEMTVIEIMAKYDIGQTSARKIKKKAEMIQKDSQKGMDWELARFLFKNNKSLTKAEIMERFDVSNKIANSIYRKVIDLRMSSAIKKREATKAAIEKEGEKP